MMLKILLCGALGRMGHAVTAACAEENASVCAGIDVNITGEHRCDFPVYEKISDFDGKADVIIDFSHHTAVEGLLAYAVSSGTPIVIATTGHTPEETGLIKSTAEKIPVFYSRNMSLGINLLISLARKASASLGKAFDVEIIEKHHNRKLDAPSGTALMIADAIGETRDETEYVYDRHNRREARPSAEIGIHTVRGGTIVGEHEVIFAGHDEIITLSHSASSREVFARGALKAAIFISGKTAGFYNMDDVIKETIG